MYLRVYVTVFLISLYGISLAQSASYFGTAQFSIWASGAVNYDYIVTNSISSLLIGLKCIPNGTYTFKLSMYACM